jgi:hypothetical protein
MRVAAGGELTRDRQSKSDLPGCEVLLMGGPHTGGEEAVNRGVSKRQGEAIREIRGRSECHGTRCTIICAAAGAALPA